MRPTWRAAEFWTHTRKQLPKQVKLLVVECKMLQNHISLEPIQGNVILYLLRSWRAMTRMGGPGALVRGNICMGEVSLIGMREKWAAETGATVTCSRLPSLYSWSDKTHGEELILR